MNVAYLTAGAAGMLCGSCLRDNTLVAALKAMGRDVTLIPLYTPIRTDESDVSEACVYYGGVNVYLQQSSFLFRHLPFGLDRLLDRPGLIRRLASKADGDPAHLGPLTVSVLRGENGAQRRELRKLIDGLRPLDPDVVHLPNAMFLGTARSLKSELGSRIVCSLTGEDVFLEKLPEPHRSEAMQLIRRHADDVDGYLCTSRYFADYVQAEYGIAADRLHVVAPGIRLDDVSAAAPPADSGEFTIGYLARICPDKGLHLLCDAFIELRRRGRDCRLAVAGYLGRQERAYWKDQQRKLEQAGVQDAVDFRGEVDRAGKLDLLRSIQVLSVPAVYREPKGLYVLEALAHGVPVVQPRHGAYPEWIEATGGGLLVEPGDTAALADALEQLMDDDALRTELGCRGRDAVFQSFSDRNMAERTWAVLQRIHERGTAAKRM
ncbi:MAG: glycosyltransferase family 4 protein [Phycisphaerae bacterium]